MPVPNESLQRLTKPKSSKVCCIKQKRAANSQSARRNAVAHNAAFIHSDDDDEHEGEFNRIRDEGAAPKSVKAARRLNKQANAKSIADLIGSDGDSSE